MKKQINISEKNYLYALKNDDVQAFDKLFSDYGKRLYHFAYGYLKSKEEAEGVVQEVFLKIWRNIEGDKPLFWEWKEGQAVRDGEWKLVKHRKQDPWDLFNVAEDPTETTNLATEYPDKVKEMDQQFLQWKVATLHIQLSTKK